MGGVEYLHMREREREDMETDCIDLHHGQQWILISYIQKRVYSSAEQNWVVIDFIYAHAICVVNAWKTSSLHGILRPL